MVEQSLKLHLLTPYLARDVQFDTSVVSVNLPKAKDTFAEILIVVIGKLLSFDKCIAEEFIHDRTNVVCIHFPSRTRKKNILKFDPIELRKRSNLVPHHFRKLDLHIAKLMEWSVTILIHVDVEIRFRFYTVSNAERKVQDQRLHRSISLC